MPRDGVLSLNGSRADILASFEDFLALADDRPIVEVPVLEWLTADGKPRVVLMRAMSAAERDDWELRFIGDQHVEPDEAKRDARLRQRTVRDLSYGMKAQLVARCVVDQSGKRIFTDDQATVLQERNAAAINRLAEKANELCGFSTADLKAVADAAKKDSAIPAPAPDSGSP